jgi:hypothetical protein
MLHAGEIRAYEVVLAPAAIRFFASLQPADQLGLGDALRTELGLGPNADKEIRFDSSIWADCGPGALEDIFYTATFVAPEHSLPRVISGTRSAHLPLILQPFAGTYASSSPTSRAAYNDLFMTTDINAVTFDVWRSRFAYSAGRTGRMTAHSLRPRLRRPSDRRGTLR